MPLTTEYHLTSDSNPSLYRAPSTNEPYSKVSGDYNPIHTNPYFAAFASLPGTITHGMFTSAATRRYVETVVAKGVPDRVFK
jgi:fatty acid synthase subunit alpha, fungi type